MRKFVHSILRITLSLQCDKCTKYSKNENVQSRRIIYKSMGWNVDIEQPLHFLRNTCTGVKAEKEVNEG